MVVLLLVLPPVEGFLGSPFRDLRVPPFPVGITFFPCGPAIQERRKRPAPPAQYPLAIVAAHLDQMSPEAVIVGVILETGLDLPCLVIDPGLVDVSDLGVSP